MAERIRRHAAIVFTDIVGYTALMGSDEERAFEVLRKNREIHTNLIERFSGTLIKEMGDGMLITFDLASDAVRCAIEIQQACQKQDIPLKIGIHEGEMVFDGKDVLGDGVNIASRIQDGAQKGTIMLSEAVYIDIKNKRDILTEFVGETIFKNVDHPIRIYKIQYTRTKDESTGAKNALNKHTGVSVELKESNKKRNKAGSLSIGLLGIGIMIAAYFIFFKHDKFEAIKEEDGRISIAVMPFSNLSGDSLLNWWQAGIQNILITQLSNSGELLVRQNQTMNPALGSNNIRLLASITPAKAGEIATELNVKAFIYGSLLKAGQKFRLITQLIETESGEIIKTFEMEGSSEDDFFLIADSLSVNIKNFLEIRKLTEESENPDIHRKAINTRSSEAFKYYIYGYEAFTNLELEAAEDWFLKAIEEDSDFINAYIKLAFTYGISENDELGKKYINLANEKRRNLSFIEQLNLDHVNAYFYGNPVEEIKILHQMLEMDDLNPTTWLIKGRAHHKLKQYSEAIVCWEESLRIYRKWDIQFPNWWIYYWLSEAYHQVDDHQKEEEIYELGLSLRPRHLFILRNQAICALSEDINNGWDKLNIWKIIAQEKGLPESFILFKEVPWICEKAGLLDSAEHYYRKALSLQPNSAERMIRLADFLIEHDIALEEGMRLNEKALAIDPDNWYGLDNRGWGYFKMGEYEKALEVLQEAWPLRPSSDVPTFGYLHIQAAEKALAN
jgi:class 3 adenylate cyclase/tetratricopeptide (TPR) repeat protein